MIQAVRFLLVKINTALGSALGSDHAKWLKTC